MRALVLVRLFAIAVIGVAACGGRAAPTPPTAPPVVVPQPPPPAPAAPSRADYPVGESPASLVVAGDTLVVTDSAGAIWTMPARGGEPTQLSEQHGIGFAFQPVVAGDQVLATTKRDLLRVDLRAGRVTKRGLALPENPVDVVADDHAVYCTLFKRDEILAIGNDATHATVLANVRRGVLARAGATLYAVSYATGVLVAIPTAGGPQRTVAKGFVRPTGLAVDDTHAFVYTEKDQTLRRVELASGATTVIATGLVNSDDLVADGAWLYTFSWPNQVVRIAKDGSRTDVLADDLKSPTHLVLAGDYLFVVSRDQNKIVRLPRET